MNKHINAGVRSLYASVCVILFCLGFMANTQTAAFISPSDYTAITQTTALIFVGVSGLYLFKYLYTYNIGLSKSWFKATGVSCLMLFLVAWTDVLSVFTTSTV